MSIFYDEAQEAIASETRRVLDARMDTARLLRLLQETGCFDEPFWQVAIEQGWTALAIPEEHGGLGLGLIELGLVAQATGPATAGAPFLTTNHGAARLLLASGKRDVQEKWLPRLATGEAIGTVAFAESSASLPARPKTVFAGAGLCGMKHTVTGGLAADFAVVWARRAETPVLVLAELGQVARDAVDSFDNSRLYADLAFNAAPAELLLEGDEARFAARDALAHMAIVTAHEQVGGAEALMLTGRDYANSRKAFGQPIGAFQAIKHRIAELYAAVEIARANCIHAAASEGTEVFLRAAAVARLTATEAYDTAARDVIQIHGGAGVTWASGLHLHLRRARSLAIEQGNTLFWEDLLVDELAGAAT